LGSLSWSVIGTAREAWRWGPDLSVFTGAVTNYFAVDSAGDTIVQLGIQLRQLELRVDAGFSDIPDSSSLNNVADDELLDGLVLGNTTSAVGAANGIGVAAAVFGSSVIAAFAGHCHAV